MKKILSLAVLAVAFIASCTPKNETICVDQFYANPTQFLGKKITITGHVAGFCNESEKLVFGGCEKENMVKTNIPAGVVVDSTWENKTIEVVGVISESTCPESGNKCYTIEATSLKTTDACCSGKDATASAACCGEKKESACCGEQKEGCNKEAAEGASKETTSGCGGCSHNKDAKASK